MYLNEFLIFNFIIVKVLIFVIKVLDLEYKGNYELIIF